MDMVAQEHLRPFNMLLSMNTYLFLKKNALKAVNMTCALESMVRGLTTVDIFWTGVAVKWTRR
jgi:hypothetical protein